MFLCVNFESKNSRRDLCCVARHWVLRRLEGGGGDDAAGSVSRCHVPPDDEELEMPSLLFVIDASLSDDETDPQSEASGR